MKVEVAGDLLAGCIAALVFIFSALAMGRPKDKNESKD